MSDTTERSRSSEGFTRFRAIMHLGLGGLYLVLSVSIVYLQHFGQVPLEQWQSIALGVLLFLYGAFRVWRGFADLKELKQTRRF